MCCRGVKHVSKREITISRIYNNKVRVLYYFHLTLFCRKSRLYFGGRWAIPTACGGRSTISVVVEFRLVHSVLPHTQGACQWALQNCTNTAPSHLTLHLWIALRNEWVCRFIACSVMGQYKYNKTESHLMDKYSKHKPASWLASNQAPSCRNYVMYMQINSTVHVNLYAC